MQIAGNTCKVCQRKIVFSNEGKLCAHCQTFVHLGCDAQPKCDVCGEPFQNYEPPEADPMRGAVLPPALRPAKSGGPMLVLILVVVLAALVVVVSYVWQGLLAQGH